MNTSYVFHVQMSDNDEFKNRDAQGLSGDYKSEADARSFYFKMLGKVVFLFGPGIAAVSVFGGNYLIPGQAALVSRKFDIISEYQLYFVFTAWCVLQ